MEFRTGFDLHCIGMASPVDPVRNRSRPLPVTIIAWVYLVMGAVGFTYHLKEWNAQQSLLQEFVWVELIRLAAVLCGVFLLRGQNWARWLAIAWIGFHVILSIWHTLPELAMHVVFCAIITYVLFRPAASRYFGRPSVADSGHL